MSKSNSTFLDIYFSFKNFNMILFLGRHLIEFVSNFNRFKALDLQSANSLEFLEYI